MIACSTKAKNILQNYGNQPTKSLITFETLIEYMIEMTCHRMYCWWERVGDRLIKQGRKLDITTTSKSFSPLEQSIGK